MGVFLCERLRVLNTQRLFACRRSGYIVNQHILRGRGQLLDIRFLQMLCYCLARHDWRDWFTFCHDLRAHSAVWLLLRKLLCWVHRSTCSLFGPKNAFELLRLLLDIGSLQGLCPVYIVSTSLRQWRFKLFWLLEALLRLSAGRPFTLDWNWSMGVFLHLKASLELLFEVFQDFKDSTGLLRVLLCCSATASSNSISLVKGDRRRHSQRFSQYVAE